MIGSEVVKIRGASPLVLAILLGGMSPALAQDLFERADADKKRRPRASYETYSGRDRFDLRAGADLSKGLLGDERGASKINLDGFIESDFACGKFDLKANLQGLISREAGEDFVNSLLGAVESELMYNALMLLAEASPTAFQLFQHWRVSANALLGIQYDRCQAIETAIQDGMQGIRARAIKDCVEEKRKLGYTMDQALKACESSDEIRGLTGDKVKELDLTEELRKAFKLSDVDFAHLEGLLSKMRLTPQGAKGEIKSEPVIERYRELRKEYYDNWAAATDALVENPSAELDTELIAKLAPPGSPGVHLVEIRELAQVDVEKRRILVEQLANQAALLDLTIQVQTYERWLAAAAKLPQIEKSQVDRMEQEIRDLRLQLSHIDELVRRQERYNAAVLSATGVAQRQQSDLAAESLSRAASDRASRNYMDMIPKWGQPFGIRTDASTSTGRGKTSTTSRKGSTFEGRGCSNCGFGDVDKK